MRNELQSIVAAVMLAAAPVAAAAAASTPQPATPAAADAVMTLTKVCLPILRGGALPATATAAGFRQKDGAWVLPIPGGGRIGLQPPDVANPHLCAADIVAPPGGGAALRAAVSAWAHAQTPPLTPVKSDMTVLGAAHARTLSSWSGRPTSATEGVVLDQEKTLQGRPTLRNMDQSTLFVSLFPA